MFNAPVSGLYLLSVYGQTVGAQQGGMFIKKDDQILCHAEIGDNDGYNNASCTAVVELTPGDSVRVTGQSNRPVAITGASGFTGHLIQEYV